MKQFKLLAAAFAISLFSVSGCKDNFESEANHIQISNKTSLQQPTRLSPELKEKLEQLRATLPAGYLAKLREKSPDFVKSDPQFQDMALKAIRAVEATACDNNTQLDQWLGQQFEGWDLEILQIAQDFALFDLPFYYAYIFENSSDNQYYGINGEYTKQLTKSFKDLKRFWNIQSDDMVMVAMHGNLLLDRDKVANTYMAAFIGLGPDLAYLLADIVVELATEIPQYRGGDHPIFSLNAFAIEELDYPPFASIPNKIVMGDGFMHSFTGIGFGDVGPQAILAHEFGHHIQFQLNLFGEYNPESTRRTELMADAFAAYYLSHARGASMQWKRVQQFLQVFYNIGDCGFENNGHHGTQAQRMAAAEWGYNLANNAKKQGHILSAQEFVRLFEAQLPVLVMR